jgi:hypothetical protein
LGGGYHAELVKGVRLTPWVAAELGYRTLGDLGAHSYAVGGTGATLRLDVSESTSFMLEAAWFPIGFSGGYEAYLTNSGPRLSLGLGFF